ncbi:hypothetical protein MK489_24120 [Myxococcota bacterium]|nr:hypothetical protein [Myxococcota bacterium]
MAVPRSAQSLRTESRVPDLLAWALLVIVLATGALLAVAALAPIHPEATGSTHPTYETMLRGGPGAERFEGVAAVGWAYGGLTLLFFTVCFGLGLRRPEGLGPLRTPLIVGALLHQLAWALLVWVYLGYADDPTPRATFLGFPHPTAVMLYVMWPFPAYFIALYILYFDRFIFTESDRRHFDELVAQYRAPEPPPS